MTKDERLISETWPSIRETVSRALPVIDALGWGDYLRAMSIERQMGFWLTWKDMDERPMPEVTSVAKMVKSERSQCWQV